MRDVVLGCLMTCGVSCPSVRTPRRPARMKAFAKKFRTYIRSVRAHFPRPPARNDSVRVVEENSLNDRWSKDKDISNAGGSPGLRGLGYYWIDGAGM